MSEKKRKATDTASERPRKKAQSAATVNVTHSTAKATAQPTIATCPGGTLPPNVKFAAYASKSDPQLLLHSSDHDTIDFTAVETRTTSTVDSHLKHYVAVYDPATNNLKVTEAKRVAIRSQVRQFENQAEGEDEEVAPAPQPSSRAALTEAFGTKKSKKAVQAIAENRLIARGSNGDDDPLSQAIQSTVAIGDDMDAQPADGPVSYKPLPQPNLATDDIREVYPLSSLVFPSAGRTLNSIPIAYWTDRASRDKPIKTSSHFISNRVGPLFHVQKITMASEAQAHARILQQIQLLRYLDLLLQIHRYLASQKRSFPPPSTWPEKTIESDFDMSTIRGILDHTFPERRTSKPAMSLFRATILAITLQIPPAGRTPDTNMLVAEPTDIIRDLAIDSKDVFALYRELGCRISPLSGTEMSIFGLDKLKGATDENGEPVNFKKVKFAKLKLPLEFPKVSQGRRERRR